MREVWPDSFVEEGNLAQNIFTLRKTLGELPEGGQYIQTIPKRGYRLVVPPPKAPPANPQEPVGATPTGKPHRASPKVYYLIATAVALASIVIGVRWVLSPRDRVAPSVRFTLLTVPNNIAYGVISPDGKHIAYVSHDAEGQSLWVRETAAVGTGTRLVPPAQGHFWGVSYSPTGEYLYYAFEDETHPAEGILFRIPAAGGQAQRLLTDVAAAPVFSPDGGRIAFKRYDSNGSGYLLTATALGSDAKTIAHSDAAYSFYNFQWAKDGDSIDFVEGTRDSNGSDWSLLEISATGGDPRIVIPPQPKALRSVVWLDRSEVLAVIPDADSGRGQIWYVGTGRPFRRLTNDINDYKLISLTDDGRTLLANTEETRDSIWTAPAPGALRADPVRLALPTGTYTDPVWTPGGEVLFVSQSNLWLSTADGLRRKPLLPEKSIVTEPVVSADGRYAVFVLHRQGSRTLWRVGLDGSDFRQLTTGRYHSHPGLSPDGRWLVYESRAPGRRALYRAPLDRAGPPVELAGVGGMNIAFSPDSKLFAYRTDQGEVEIRSLDDGSLLRTMAAPGNPSDMHWNSDGKTLTYTTHSGRSEQFWTQPVAGGPATPVGEPLPSDVFGVDWSSDGKRIVYLRREIKVDLALIANIR